VVNPLEEEEAAPEEDTTCICGYCDGTGEAGRAGSRRCSACKGTGEVVPGAEFAEDDGPDDDYDEEPRRYRWRC